MIDVNAYLGPFAFRRLRHNTPDGLLRLMDRKGIERAVVSSAAAITYRNAQAGNEEVAEQIRGRGDRFIGCAVLNPAYAGWPDDLKICAEEFGMRALRLYPRWHHYRLTDAACRALVEAASERGMAITIPVRVEDRRQQSWLVDVADVAYDEIADLIRAAPRARVIVVNCAGAAASVLSREREKLGPNWAVEISLAGDDVLAGLGEDRVVFGTGMPFHYPDPALVKLDVLEAPAAVKEKIKAGNARRLLKL